MFTILEVATGGLEEIIETLAKYSIEPLLWVAVVAPEGWVVGELELPEEVVCAGGR
jgi:hypothetical protein